ncbi:MAG: endo-1,4-beta-xylanase [Clostridiales bacterium]|nr:endo-1,4-beta-xylanase [Clostridiales bacterium]
MKMRSLKLLVLFIAVQLMAAAGCGIKVASQVPEAPLQTIWETTGLNATETPEEEIMSIYKKYGKHGIKAGTCLSGEMIANSRYTDIIKANFNSITLENLMKPDYILNRAESISSGDIVVEFSPKTIELLDWAKSNGMSMRGHVLIWYSQTPNWIFYEDFDTGKSPVDRDTMLARMESYIKQVFDLLDALGYMDLFYAYDVVNEGIMEDGSLRDCLWKQVIGEDYIWHAFSFAKKYAPDSIGLFYNDYNEQFKAEYIVKLAQSLVDENGNYLIDGIGCQGHLYTQDSIDSYIETLKSFSDIGLDVQITELDVSLGSWMTIDSATEENLKVQGRYFYELISRIIEENEAGNTRISSITYWGFVDNLSWRSPRSPLLYDAEINPKYAYYGAILDYDRAGH